MNRLLQLRPSLVSLTIQRSFFGSSKKVELKITNRQNEEHVIQARLGDTLLDTVLDNMIENEGFGICGGGVACSTCHIGTTNN